MKIKEVNCMYILFDNNKRISYSHEEDCCELNYADFPQLDSIARDYDFEEPLLFEAVHGSGFRFGNKNAMFFVPCYSEQNGYYSTNIDIYYDNKPVLCLQAELIEM